MKKESWLSYSDLAWTEPILSDPSESREETEIYCQHIKDNAFGQAETLLHLACGAGYNDYSFKNHFQVTGVDLSSKMLEQAKKINPEVEYILGDMRTVDLHKQFDAVVIPDGSLGYMLSEEDLKLALANADRHLRPGGVLLFTISTKEEFQDNNFVYIGSKDDIQITVFENNYLLKNQPHLYQATMFYLIHNQEKSKTYIDQHTLGLFELAKWRELLSELKYHFEEFRMDNLYDENLMDEGEYPMTMFVCIKPVTDKFIFI